LKELVDKLKDNRPGYTSVGKLVESAEYKLLSAFVVY
jgi:hypothetical protein